MPKKFNIFIDQEKFTIEESTKKAKELLVLAGEDPAATTLVLKKGNDLSKYDDSDEISLKNGMHFVVFHDGPTPVSNFGPDRFKSELDNLGYETELITASDNNKYAIIKNYVISIGKFLGKEIDLGLLATSDFPLSVASAIHIRSQPQLYEESDTIPNVRNITKSPLGPDWRYWSINFNWNKGDKTRRLISKINTVFKNA